MAAMAPQATEDGWRITMLDRLTPNQREQAALTLVEGFGHQPSGYRTIEIAREEVARYFDDDDRSGFAALEDDTLLGWIGLIEHSANGWELHPLVVREGYRGRGVGTALVEALETAAGAAGVATVWLGTDDDFDGTNLFGRDLYPDVLERLIEVAPTSGHPFTFYTQLGYSVVGVLPDVSGPGMHDILLAKRVS